MDYTDKAVEELLSNRPLITAACTHGNDAAVHTAAMAWAKTVAEKWHKEAPPLSDGRWLHFEYGCWRRHDPDAFETCPDKFDDCALINRSLLGDAWRDLFLERESAESPIAPPDTIAPSELDAAKHEAQAWAQAWAERLHSEAPSPDTDYIGHLMHKNRRLWTDEVRGTFPQHLRGYGFEPGDLALRAVNQHAVRLRDEEEARARQ